MNDDNMPQLISSQKYRDTGVVQAKRAAQDYSVRISPVFEVGGNEYQVVLDGHHALSAAISDGVDPELIELTKLENDTIDLMGNVENFLDANHMGDDWHDAITGVLIF